LKVRFVYFATQATFGYTMIVKVVLTVLANGSTPTMSNVKLY